MPFISCILSHNPKRGLCDFFASYLLKEKVPGKVIQELLGHSQISTTMMIYAHLAENIKKEVLKEVDRKWQ